MGAPFRAQANRKSAHVVLTQVRRIRDVLGLWHGKNDHSDGNHANDEENRSTVLVRAMFCFVGLPACIEGKIICSIRVGTEVVVSELTLVNSVRVGHVSSRTFASGLRILENCA